ncbi:uncharacterized protein OCT59_027749 [Rhizophagus irregularis]|uniref:GDP-fucose protein O-fucosyltransferase 2 n=7 Tax=Rhizophagus irregularis TaxID=588596 RepID=A0A916E4W8_9GLOM|nr:hypothetical protein RirG_230850 [Rhizophagus irregularis DAOM 197198w]UZO07465.1 hypothetical protein OCT59_027749 [Rhizophagus irregularis]GBC15701.1 hypothetical protein GLOIN_2v1470381 [Rhizophagus irregularis DAOM 181602=DAOM 197198]CAB4479316.1 unnamed protein product [Rhizophagus irregularis]CAB5362528.1 unnamed protein product [Rhizophagus irregularis]
MLKTQNQSICNPQQIKRTILFILYTYIIYLIISSISNTNEKLEKVSLSQSAGINDETDFDIIKHDEKVNLKYCGEKTCNFMFPYFIPEQETRANLHFRSLTFLAESLNRIMVLPNVGNSRIDCCTKFPFEFYYDLEKMKKMFPSIKFMTQQTFKEWTKELLIKPDTLHTWFIEDGRNDSYSIRDHNQMAVEPGVRYEKNLLSKLCINQFDLKISDYMEFHTGIGHVNDFEHKMFNFFTENLKDIKSPVILIRNRSRRQMFPLIEEQIPFAPHIIKQADEIVNKLQSYYCIHWRMEQGILEKMPKCAENLIETINYLKMTEEINNVYLATDYPISGGKSASDTFYSVRKEHRIAIQMLNSTLNFNTWVSLNAFKEFRNDKKYDSEFSSSGIHGILDKLVCIQSDYFLSGPKDCCRIRSTYTRLISEERKDLIDNGDKRIRNVITRWGKS